ncbi:MAG: helix-turn-helix domain-containing protein [Bacteroidales bacterium]
MQQTLIMHQSGMSVEEIVAARSMQRPTVYSHLAQLITEDKITNWSDLIQDYELRSVQTAKAKLGGTEELKPLFENLNGAIEYGKIRLALAVLKK